MRPTRYDRYLHKGRFCRSDNLKETINFCGRVDTLDAQKIQKIIIYCIPFGKKYKGNPKNTCGN